MFFTSLHGECLGIRKNSDFALHHLSHDVNFCANQSIQTNKLLMCSLWARQWHLNVSDSSSMTHIGIRFLVTLAELDFWRQSCFERLATTSPGSLLDIIFIATLLVLILFQHESYSLFLALTHYCLPKKQKMNVMMRKRFWGFCAS